MRNQTPCFYYFSLLAQPGTSERTRFNLGEYVEGYTSFLWMLMMAGAIGLRMDVDL